MYQVRRCVGKLGSSKGKLLAERGEGEAKLLLPDVPGEEMGRKVCWYEVRWLDRWLGWNV